MTIAIIGGGASGMMAALAATERKGRQVVLLERQARVGRKLAVTGNGRCNLSNRTVSAGHYHGTDPAFCIPALEAFDVTAAQAYFRDLGLITITEPDGRIYPFSDSANSVVDVLRFACEAAGVDVRTGCRVTSVKKNKQTFTIQTEAEALTADRVIIACGGCAGAKVGGVRDGYDFLKAFGHRMTALKPALVQLKTAGGATKALKGVRAEAVITARNNGKQTAQIAGEVQFTDYGVSGPAIFEIASSTENGTELEMNLMPMLSEAELYGILQNRCRAMPQLTAADVFTGILQNRLGRVVVSAAGISPTTLLTALDDAALRKLTAKACRFTLTVAGTMGFDNAQVTAGGIMTADFDPHTLESRKVPGLYAAGEVLDIDGDCGGFNLQWAWSSGRLAGLSASE